VSLRFPYGPSARQLSADLLSDQGRRWRHVQGVARRAEELSAHLNADESDLLAASAWLHDVGYAVPIALTGLHSLDGAVHLLSLKYPTAIVGLVAYHTNARYEAEERGLLDEFLSFVAPPEHLLDLLTTADLSTGTTGEPVDPQDRISEVLRRYEPQDPVHRAALRSRVALLASVERTRERVAIAQADGHRQPT
jgi:hypothetical protein